MREEEKKREEEESFSLCPFPVWCELNLMDLENRKGGPFRGPNDAALTGVAWWAE